LIGKFLIYERPQAIGRPLEGRLGSGGQEIRMSGFVWGQVWITRGIVKWCSVHHARDPVKKSGGAAIPVRCATEGELAEKWGKGRVSSITISSSEQIYSC
jgi:hypothetical protein